MPDASWIDLAGCDLAALLRGIILIGKAKQSREDDDIGMPRRRRSS
jgi:hypothetical protein